jgi:acetolactate synthase-1/2/3 large subunit
VKVSDYVAEELDRQGVRHVYEMIGGMIAHLIDSIHRRGRPRLVSLHHEQAAALAACGEAQMTGVPGVALATSGPGAVNLLTGVATCHFDSVPAVFLTGQVNRSERKGERPIRQLGFQETDIVAMAAPVVKAAWRIEEPRQIPELLPRAFALAREGRPGPVLLDIPMDVQQGDVGEVGAPAPERGETSGRVDPEALAEAVRLIRSARRPLVLAGGGVRASGTCALFRRLLRRLGLPAVHSLMGVDLLGRGDPLRVGMIGTYGNRWANWALGESDLLLVLGSRLDIRQTGKDTDSFARGRRVVHVDVEPGELGNRVRTDLPIRAHLRPFLEALEAAWGEEKPLDRADWIERIRGRRRAWPDTEEPSAAGGIHPNRFLRRLGEASPRARAFVADVGQNQMWAAQSLEVSSEQRFLTSGGMGAMGYALPAAIGAALAAPGGPVVAIAGDGGVQCNLQELEAIGRGKLPIKMVVLDNGCLGMVRQFQEEYFEGRCPSTRWGYGAPDFPAVAEAFGIPGLAVEGEERTEEGLERLWAEADRPFLLAVRIAPDARALPKTAFGRPLWDMEPRREETREERDG